MHLTDAQLRRLVASDPSDAKAKQALAQNTAWALLRKLPNPTGTLYGREVYADQRGAMSSGYVLYAGNHGIVPTDEIPNVVWDTDPRRERLRAVASKLLAGDYS